MYCYRLIMPGPASDDAADNHGDEHQYHDVGVQGQGVHIQDAPGQVDENDQGPHDQQDGQGESSSYLLSSCARQH